MTIKVTKMRGKNKGFFKFHELGVDSGSLSVLDESIAELSQEENAEQYGSNIVAYHELEDGPGLYEVKYKLPHSWNGPDDGMELVSFPSGKVIVGDACYSFDKNWHKFLDETDHLSGGNDGYVNVNTGGDGQFDLQLKFKRIGDVDEDTEIVSIAPFERLLPKASYMTVSVNTNVVCPHCESTQHARFPHKKQPFEIAGKFGLSNKDSLPLDRRSYECYSCNQPFYVDEVKRS